MYRESMAKSQQRDLLQKVFQKMGLAVYRFKKDHAYCPEELVIKAMKFVDIEEILPFGDLARNVINHNRTRLGYDRLYMLYQAVWNVRHLSTGASLAEVGVYKGGSAYFIASVAERLFDQQPRIHGFDTFEGHSSEDINPVLDAPHRPGKFSDTSFAAVSHYLSDFPNVVLHKGRFQDRSAEISGESFCFVHIDVDIYAATRACLDFFGDALLVGGIIIVDDYGFKTCEGAVLAVDSFLEERNNFIKFHLETGQGLLIRKS